MLFIHKVLNSYVSYRKLSECSCVCDDALTPPPPPPQDDKLCEVAAQRYYVDQGQSIVPGKLQASLHQYIPDRKLKESSKNRDGWTQSIMSSFEEQGFSSAKVPAKKVRISISYSNPVCQSHR